MGKYLRFIVVGGLICCGFLLEGSDIKQLAHLCQVIGPSGVGEQAVVADTVEAVRQDMDEKAADELRCRQGHVLVAGLSFCSIVLPLEGDALVITGDQTAVGDGDAVGVTAEIGEDRFRPTKWRLGVDHPLGLV